MRRVICAYQTCACVFFSCEFCVASMAFQRLHLDAIDAFPTPIPRRRREVESTNRRRRQEPRRVGLLDSFQLLGAGVARAEDGRARRGLRRERRLVHAARVGLGRGAERARDAERGGCFCRLCCCCCSITWLGLHAASMAYSRSDPFSLTSLHRAEARRWCTGGYRRRTPPHQYKTSSTRISTPPVRQRRTSARNERVSPRRRRDGMSTSTPSRRRRSRDGDHTCPPAFASRRWRRRARVMRQRADAAAGTPSRQGRCRRRRQGRQPPRRRAHAVVETTARRRRRGARP